MPHASRPRLPLLCRLPCCTSPLGPSRGPSHSPFSVLSPCGAAGCCSRFCLFFFPPCFFPHGSLVPACTHNNTALPSVSVPFSALVQPLAVPGHASWAPLPRDPAFYPALLYVYLLSLLSTLPCPLSPACPLGVVLLLRVLAAGRPRAMVVSRAPSRASGLLPCLPTCRPTWAASPDTRSGGLPLRPLPPAALHQFPDGRAGWPVRLNAGHRHGASL